MDEDVMGAMYGQNEGDGEPQEQPIQLRLAGKANIVTLGGRQIAIPKIEYVEALEARLASAERIIGEQNDMLKRNKKTIASHAATIHQQGQQLKRAVIM